MAAPTLVGFTLLCLLAAGVSSTKEPTACESEEEASHSVELLQRNLRLDPSPEPAEARLHTERSSERSPTRLLLFMAVGAPYMKLSKANINHLRAARGVQMDVFLVHYDTQQAVWLESDREWYVKNVQFSLNQTGQKWTIAKDALNNRSMIDISTYDWIWLPDEDMDTQGTDFELFLYRADESQALIVGPAFHTNPAAAHPYKSNTAALLATGGRCQPGQIECEVQAPDPRCKFRHTNFIEVAFPMFRPEAFRAITECQGCLHRRSCWGAGNMWCSYLGRVLRRGERNRTCAIVDSAPILHLNLRTGGGEKPEDYQAKLLVRQNFYRDWVDHPKTIECVTTTT